jgi:putative spermidine/putrescine transport system permease protein
MTNPGRSSASALLLLAPMIIFLAVFFVWPLLLVLKEAISNGAVGEVLPRTAAAASRWDGKTLPDADFREAFVEELRALDDQRLGDLVRRLNSEQPGFRTLMSKTVAAARHGGVGLDLASIDKRWDNVNYWQAIARTLSPYTDKNLLAAVDLKRNAVGTIVEAESGASANREILLRTFSVSALVTIACLFIGLPFAILLTSATGWYRRILLGAVLLPLWTSLLVRTAAWYILLQDRGVINKALLDLGLIGAPLPLIFNRLGVVIAMTHVLLPFMVLPIYSVLIAIPQNLMPAAASLGAHPFTAFRRVLLPLSLRGVAAGSLLVFMSALGYYITPALIGGANDQMVSSVIAFYATGSANWGMAAALGLVLLGVTLALYAVYSRLSADPSSIGA